MDASGFRKYGNKVIDFAVDYLENEHERRVYPDVKPGYLRHALAREAPKNGEEFQTIMEDFQSHIMPGVTHWQSPYFLGYYPSLCSYPSLLGELLSSSLNGIGFTWASNPACTELEIVVLDWLAKMLKLPQEFWSYDNDGNKLYGGSIIQSTASDAVLVAVLSARESIMEKLKALHPNADEHSLLSKLVGYESDQTHIAFRKACKIAAVKYRTLESNADNELDGDTLKRAIEEDVEKGLVPFMVCATLGTTSTCSFDRLQEIGPICNDNNIWLHVDAAYAGATFICPEYRPLLDGIEFADSFNMNCHKLMLVNFDCSPFWVKDKIKVVKALKADFVMFDEDIDDLAIDYKDMQVPLGRRFRALKLWFVIRNYGVEGLQQHIYKHTQLSKYFSGLVESDNRFETLGCRLGLTLFRLKGSNELNDILIEELNKDGKIHITPTFVKGQRIIRVVVCSQSTTKKHLDHSWDFIQKTAVDVLEKNSQYLSSHKFCN